jgi:hypothetical protein
LNLGLQNLDAELITGSIYKVERTKNSLDVLHHGNLLIALPVLLIEGLNQYVIQINFPLYLVDASTISADLMIRIFILFPTKILLSNQNKRCILFQ